jgi:putative RecB family exonuclease
MALPLPTSLSPSKVSSFKDCALAFRFSAIDRLPEPPSVPAVKGTTVHRALELLLLEPPSQRTPARAHELLRVALDEIRTTEEFSLLGLTEDEITSFAADASTMVGRYFELEDPTSIAPIGLELMLSTELGGTTVRGIIDRLELDADGEFVVTDYKTGRAPSERYEQSRLGGVHFYAYLCEQILGRRPARIQLMYLGADPQVISVVPTAQSTRGLERRLGAIWTAVEKACETEDFRPKPSPLCNWCSFKGFCPAFGGRPEDAQMLYVRPGPQQTLDLAAGA